MKRSCESCEDTIVKRQYSILDSGDSTDNSTDNSSTDTSNNLSNSSNISSNNISISATSHSEGYCTDEDNIHCFVPSNIERQIVRMTLSRIRTANMYNWDIENSTEYADYMVLRDFGVIFDPETCREHSCELYITIKYNWEITFCEIQCCYNNDIIRLNMNWDTPIDGLNILYINKTVEQTYYLVFNQKITKEYKVFVSESNDHAWCYFMDNRYHLDRICP